MNTLIRIMVTIYSWLAALYPRSFRLLFEEEMCLVFSSAVHDAANLGVRHLLAVTVKEFGIFPWAILSEYYHGVQRYIDSVIFRDNSKVFSGQRSNEMIKSYLQHQTGFQNKRHIIVAAMPPLLFALGLSLMWLVAGGKRWYEIPRWRLYASLAIGLLPNVIIFLGAVVAVFRRIPAWGYTWVGTVLLGLFFLLQGIAEELIENGIYPFSAAAENTVGVMLLLVYVVALGAIAMRGWWQAGLVSIGMASIFGLSICHTLAIPPFNRQDLALLSLPMALMISMLIYTYIQGNLLRKVLVFVFVELLNVGIALVAAQVWQTHEGVVYALIGLMSGVLLAGPLLSLIGFPLRQRMQPQV